MSTENDPLELEESWEIFIGPRKERNIQVEEGPEKIRGFLWMGLRHYDVEVRGCQRQAVPMQEDMVGSFQPTELWEVTGIGLWLSRTGDDLIYTKNVDLYRLRPGDTFDMTLHVTGLFEDMNPGFRFRRLFQLLEVM
jgi:hypothetical protein